MEEKVLLQKGNNLQLEFTIAHDRKDKMITFTSKKHICGAVFFQLKVIKARCVGYNDSDPDINFIISIRFTKLLKDDNLTYSCKFTSKELQNLDVKITENKSCSWHLVHVHELKNATTNTPFTFVASFNSDLSTTINSFAPLYEDTDSTDFKLCAEEGSIEVHKLVLKASSPVLQGMLNGEWKETTEGKITIADASKETLQKFKDYIYLDKLPNTGIKQLLLLGSYLMMPDLVQKCVVKLLNELNNENFIELVGFSFKFKITKLCLTLLKFIELGVVSVDNFSEDNFEVADLCEAANSILTLKHP